MTEYINDLILGLGPGALLGALAMAVVISRRGSGFLNLAAGTQAFYAATTYALLRQGRLLQPIPWLPGRISVGGRLSFGPAVVATLMIQAVLAVALYAVVARPLRARGAAVQTIATLGAAVALDALVDLREASQQVVVHPIFSAARWHVGGIRIPMDRVAPALIVLALAAAVAVLYRWPPHAGVLTGQPAPGTPLGNWVLSSLVAGLAGILAGPLLSLVSGQYALLVVPALAAAVAGRVDNIGVAAIGGLLIGGLEAVVIGIAFRHHGVPVSAADAVPLLVVVLAVIVRRSLLPEGVVPSLPVATRAGSRGQFVLPLLPVLPGLLVGAAAVLAFTGTYRLAFANAFIFSVISLSLVVITGFAGQISFAQLTLAGVGGFSLSTVAHGWHVPFPVAPVVAAGAAAVVGVAIGLLSLRGRGLSVAVISLAVATGVEGLWFLNLHLDGGVGGATVPVPRLFGLDLGIGTAQSPRPAFGLLCLVVLALVALAVGWFRRSRVGAAMRGGDQAAGVTLIAFALAGFIAGLGGCLIAYEQSHLTVSGFDTLLGLIFFATAYVSGVTSVGGGVLAGLLSAGGPLFILLNHAFTVGNWYGVIVGIGVGLAARYAPEGLAGLAAAAVPRWLRRWRLWKWWRRSRFGRVARRFVDL